MNNSTNASTFNSTILPRAAQVGPQTFVFLSGVFITILAICWVLRIIRTLNRIKKELDILENGDLEANAKMIRTVKTNRNKHLYLLCVTLFVIGHTIGRSIIYINFVFLTYYGAAPKCSNSVSPGLKFAYDSVIYIYPVLAICDGLFIASMIGLGTFLLFVRETYNYFGKNLKSVKKWVGIGIFQIGTVTLCIAIPYITILGGALFTLWVIVDIIFLIFAKIKLIRILQMKKIDAAFQSDLKFRYKQCIKGINRLSHPFLITLSIYGFGLILEHATLWITTAECFFKTFYGTTSVQPDIKLKTDIASFLWIIIYITVIQFDVITLLIVVAYFCHSRSNRRALECERRRLIAGVAPRQYTDAESDVEA